MTKRLFKIAAVLVSLCVFAILFVIGSEFYYLDKFEKTKLDIAYDTLQLHWGKPDKIYRYKNGTKSVFYYSPINEFVFNIDDHQMVDLKYKEDF
ncbi:MAG: hypothetical protein QM710_04775 [Flavobacterium sp.]